MLALITPTVEHMEKCYFILVQGFDGFYSCPAPNSLVVTAVNDRAQQGRFKSTPRHKDSKQMDLMGRKIYTFSSLQMCVANQQPLLSKYYFMNWMAVSKIAGQLPEALREAFGAFITEGSLVAKTLLKSMLNVMATLARVASVVTMRRVSRLQNLGTTPDVQQAIGDLPFGGLVLFLDKMDDSAFLQGL
ncbi:hypothetical protein KIL84_006886 [Mauremys mutica]|uniref:Uncharacterized protein n=1 Tax=Mauremys mutica TaxID=74926 RepID=A0A9D4AUJ2_9SAUR|nr:hypothetical protein KIL84_006886 [Mauremys mutica]